MSGNNEALKVNVCLVFLSTLLRIAERLAAEQLLLIPQDFSVTLILLYQYCYSDFGQFAKIDTITLCIRNETFLPFFGIEWLFSCPDALY